MRVVKVIPISKGISKEVLSYFTTQNIPLGSLVEVELRKRKIKGLLIYSEDAVKAKSEIRSADFTLKKIEKIEYRFFLSPAFISAAEKTANYFAGTTGAVLNAVIPKAVLTNLEMMEIGGARSAPPISPFLNRRGTKAEGYIIQNGLEDRFAAYRSIVRESFAKQRSVFIVIPTHENGINLKTALEKGIEDHTILLTSSLSKKKLLEARDKLQNDKHPTLTIGTVPYLSLAREDLRSIIVENESSAAYRNLSRPFIDFRYFAEVFANESGSEFILADQYLRIETLGRYDNSELVEKYPLQFRPENMAENELIDMKKYRKSSGASFQVLSDELISQIEEMAKRKEKMFIFSARRGLSPTTTCSDCGTVVTCNNCGAPTVLHKSKKDEKENFFLCHHCGEKRSALEKCKNCGGWRLASLGIGIEKVEEQLAEKFPNVPVFRLDRESAPTEKKARDIVKKFYGSNSGAILLGTEMALLYHRQEIPYSAVSSMDSIFSLPDFHINERVFHILLALKSRTEKKLLIQTRNPEQPALDQFLQGRFSEFYRQELKSRLQFGYPPFKTLIKISLEGKKTTVTREMEKLETIFKDYQLFIFPAFVGTSRGNFVLHSLIKIDSRNWPDEDLLQRLLSLPPNFTVRINPESLL